MKIIKHSQSCFLIESARSRVLLDPGTFVFEKENLEFETFSNIDAIIITHEHSDHFDLPRLKSLIQRDNPIIFATPYVLAELEGENLAENSKILGSASEESVSDLTISGMISKHGPLSTGLQEPFVSGVVIDDGNTRFYSPGDSLIFDNNAKADVIAVPISGTVTMNIKEAAEMLLELMPKMVIPMHYDSPKYPVDVNDFVKKMEDTGIEVKVLKNGESVEL